jgi:FkbH-like protein
MAGMPYSPAGEKAVGREITRIADALTSARKKVLIVDLDNTLWGGVVGEEGVSGLELAETGAGARFKDFQRRIHALKDVGVVLAVASKNNLADVVEVFDSHRDMALKLDDFAIKKINWSPKPQNIAEIAADLDLGSDSFVFIDDNPVERAAVREAMPEVTVPEFPADTTLLPAFMDQVYWDHFYVVESTDEDRKRTRSYFENAQRAEARKAAPSVEEFLVSLKTRILLAPVRPEDVARAAQLTQKTNQFNLTTRRYTEQDVERFVASPEYLVRIGSVVDRFGDTGKVFLAIARKVGARIAELDTFLMSCRVMGRFIEDQILEALAGELRAEGVNELVVRYLPTKKNVPARAFVERLAGDAAAADEQGGLTRTFDLRSGAPLVTKPPYAELALAK